MVESDLLPPLSFSFIPLFFPVLSIPSSLLLHSGNTSTQQDPKESKPPSSKPTPLSSQQDFVPGTDIPIFTDQFLQHNRGKEVMCQSCDH